MNVLSIDLETTGVEENCNSIVEIGASYWVDGVEESDFSIKVKSITGRERSLEAMKINSIFSSDDQSDFYDIDEALEEFAEYLVTIAQENPSKLIVLGHNVNFDLRFLKANFERIGITKLENIINFRVRDTATLAQFLTDAGHFSRCPNLQILAKHLDIEVEDALLHTAYYDAKLAAEVYHKLVQKESERL